MKQYFYFIGENIDGAEVCGEAEEATLEECRQYCKELLEDVGGGHLDIYNQDDCFIDDVEV